MTHRDFTEQDIHLALDGEMPTEDRLAFDKWLDANPDMKARSLRFADDRESLRQALPVEPVPQRFLLALGGEAGSNRGLPSWYRIAAVLAVFLLGAAGGYGLGLWQRPDALHDRAFANNAIQAHDMYSAEKLHVVEVKADQRDHLIGWLSKRVGVHLVAPDFSAEGYELIGGRLLPDAGKAAAQFMYQGGNGERISLYVTREPDRVQTGFRSLVEGSTRAFYWMDDDYGCAIAGVAPEKTLLSLADSTYRQYLAAETR